ncbi:MAG: hypothetical protein E6767_12135 [Dysgonomonas sp.]|nr:hypothetical protein [Dysgonomonas sp.]
MIQKFCFILLLACTLTACGTANLGSKMRKIEIGMTKKEVTSILGDSYDVMRAIKTPEGTLDVWKYTPSMSVNMYMLHFLDGKLVEWFLDVDPALQKAQSNEK